MAKTDWLVVETSYPTTYGCHRGRRWSRLEMIEWSDVKVHGPYGSFDVAETAARNLAEEDCHFCGYDFEETWGEGPPFDSAAAENWDNDTEMRFEVLRRSEYDERKQQDEEHVALATGELRFREALKERTLAEHVKAVGRVYYPRSPSSLIIPIKADVELKETDVNDNRVEDNKEIQKGDYVVVEGLEKKKEYNGQGGYVKKTGDERHVVTLASGGDKDIDVKPVNLRKPPEFKCAKENATSLRFDADSENDSLGGEDALAAACRGLPNLEEIHYFSGRVLRAERLKAVLVAAPHLAKNLEFFRCAYIDISPEGLEAFAGFRGLRRLDLTMCVSTEYSDCDNFDGYDSDESFGMGKKKPNPYDEPLAAVVAANPKLTQIDLGYGEDDMVRYFWDYCFTHRAMTQLQRKYPRIKITMSGHHEPIPEPITSTAKDQIIGVVLHALARDDDIGIRANAKKALKGDLVIHGDDIGVDDESDDDDEGNGFYDSSDEEGLDD